MNRPSCCDNYYDALILFKEALNSEPRNRDSLFPECSAETFTEMASWCSDITCCAERAAWEGYRQRNTTELL